MACLQRHESHRSCLRTRRRGGGGGSGENPSICRRPTRGNWQIWPDGEHDTCLVVIRTLVGAHKVGGWAIVQAQRHTLASLSSLGIRECWDGCVREDHHDCFRKSLLVVPTPDRADSCTSPTPPLPTRADDDLCAKTPDSADFDSDFDCHATLPPQKGWSFDFSGLGEIFPTQRNAH